jgi:hypothetical protein
LHAACDLYAWLHFAHFPVVVCCTLSVGSCLRAICLLHVARSPLHVVCFLFPAPVSHVAWCALPVACPTSHGARCLSLIPRRISSRCNLLRCESSVACCLFAGARPCRPVLHVDRVCRMPCVARCRVAKRRHTRSASRRRSQFSASAAGEALCSADRGVPACVCECAHASVTVCLCGLAVRA